MILQQENELQAIQLYYILEKHLKLALLDFSTGKVFSITWCMALEDFENCFSKRLFKSSGKVTCELELKERKEKHVL